MKIKEENYKTVDLFSLCKDVGISNKDSTYLLNNIKEKSINQQIKTIKRIKKEPIQYVLGFTNFYGYEYKVNKNVLIPRFETEELVENTLVLIRKHFKKDIKVLDLGTGSGCIGITLKKEMPNLNVTISDISSRALDVAKENAKGMDIEIIKGNLFKPFIENKIKFSVIISNPPYISINDSIDSIVKFNEPHLALYAKNNGLYFYEKIFKDINKVLEEKFLIALEIGMNQKDEIFSIINKYLNDVTIIIKQDLQGRDRMIFIHNLTNIKKDV